MKFGLSMPPIGTYSDPNYLASMADEAEQAGWDGFFPLKWREIITVDEWRDILDYLDQHRTGGRPYDLVQGGVTPGDEPVLAAKIVKPFDELGLTWWVEHIDPWRFGLGREDLVTPEASRKMAERIRQGPPNS